jgi:hypothetical protein
MAKLSGAGLGYATARAEELRATWLPDRAYADEIARWERLYGLAPRALDSLDVRRQRVAAFVARDNGYSPEQLQEVLADPFDLAVDDVEILEFSNTITDDFATLELERWFTDPAAAWTIASGALKGERLATVDARWDLQNRKAYRCLTSLSSGEGRVVLLAKLSGWTLSSDAVLGLQLFNGRTGNSLWFGLKGGGTDYVGHVSYVDGEQAAFHEITSGVTSPIWLRIIKDADVAGRYVLGYSSTGPTSGFTDETFDDLIPDPEWAGFGILGLDASGAADNSVSFDDVVIITPEGTRPFNWYAYRDPGLAGDPDLLGANLLLRRLRPAHTHAAAITSLSLLCDDVDDGGCDRGPMGAL